VSGPPLAIFALENAAALRDAVADASAAAITVGVAPDTLDRVAEAWGPSPPPG
jgi:hypothetical protein